MQLKVSTDNGIRQNIMLPKQIQIAFKLKANEVGNKLGRNVSQVELADKVGRASLKKVLTLFE